MVVRPLFTTYPSFLTMSIILGSTAFHPPSAVDPSPLRKRNWLRVPYKVGDSSSSLQTAQLLTSQLPRARTNRGWSSHPTQPLPTPFTPQRSSASWRRNRRRRTTATTRRSDASTRRGTALGRAAIRRCMTRPNAKRSASATPPGTRSGARGRPSQPSRASRSHVVGRRLQKASSAPSPR